jgi:uncharacterized protein involved in response to NO
MTMPTHPPFLRTVTAAPHRLFFFAGACQLIVVMLWWLMQLGGQYSGGWTPPVTLLAPLWVHLYLMLFGIFPFFIFGFLLTVYPRWMAGAPVAYRQYVAIALLLITGTLGFYVGVYTHTSVLAMALLLVLAAWLTALYSLVTVYRRARQRGVHETVLNLALLAGAAGVALYLYGVTRGDARAFLWARTLGLWLFLLPVVFSVSHRMLPFFTSSTLVNYTLVRPAWSPLLMAVCVTGHALLDMTAQPRWMFLFDLPLAVTAFHHSVLWGFGRSFQARLLAVLHVAFVWFGIAMTLYTVQSLSLWWTDMPLLGRAPLHALGIGYFGGMVLAMAARVTLGHSGRPLIADRLTWYAFLGLNLAALLRIGAELPFLDTLPVHALNLGAAAVWLASVGFWAWRYAPMLLRRRIDGKAG